MFDTTAKKTVTCTKINTFPADSYPSNYEKNDLKSNHSINEPTSKISKLWLFLSNKLSLSSTKVIEGNNGVILPHVPPESTKLYKRRFWMLSIFFVCSMLNAFQWIQYAIISNIIECYHNVDAFAVNWTSTIYMIAYIVLVLPVSWFIGRFDVKAALLVGSLLNCISTIILCTSLNRDGFPIALFSQSLAAIAQVFILPLPPRIAAVWFGSEEVGRATAVGVFGNQFGIAIGYIIPPLIVPNDCSNPEAIKFGRSILAYALTGANLVNFLSILATFETKPPLPPSEGAKSVSEPEYTKSLINLIRNKNFLALLLSYGALAGLCLAIGSLLNQMLAPIFPDSEETIGWLGISANLLGFISAFVAGYIVDKTHKFKETAIAICLISLGSQILMSSLLYIKKLWVQCITLFFSGFFLNSFFPVGLDFAAELTYPEPEGTSAGIMNASSMVFAVVIIMVGSFLIQTRGILFAYLFFISIVAVACLACVFIKPELKRLKKNTQKSENGAVKRATESKDQP